MVRSYGHISVIAQLKWVWSKVEEVPRWKCFESWLLISCIFVKLFVKFFVPHDRWETNLHFFSTFWIVIPSNSKFNFLSLRVILDKIKEWFINTLIERVIFWSKINSVISILLFFLHFSNSFAISFFIFTMITFYNGIINSFWILHTTVRFKIISIFENNEGWERLNTILVFKHFIFICVNFSNMQHWRVHLEHFCGLGVNWLHFLTVLTPWCIEFNKEPRSV